VNEAGARSGSGGQSSRRSFEAKNYTSGVLGPAAPDEGM